LEEGEDSDDLYQNVDQLKYLRVRKLLVYLVLSDVEGDIEESHQLEFKLTVLQSKLDLHSLHRVRLHDQINILLEVVLDDLHFHLLLVVCSFTTLAFSSSSSFLLLYFVL
jgi:hypothetical protein